MLYGMRYSVYVRIARVVLAEKGLSYRHIEVNPFLPNMPQGYLRLHPFRRVPTLVHNDFALYETGAITRYIDEQFEGPSLQPIEPHYRARMAQIISIIDCYGYHPMVRQLHSNRIFLPRIGRPVDEAQVTMGVKGSELALGALESISAADGPLAGGQIWSLADFHLAPMMAYFTAAPEGGQLLARHPKLSAWWDRMRRRPALCDTDPGPPAGLGSFSRTNEEAIKIFSP
jgi:glutathione S-transferase